MSSPDLATIGALSAGTMSLAVFAGWQAADVVAGKVGGPLGVQLSTTAHSAFMSGMDATMLISALLAVLAAALVLAFLPTRQRATPARQAGIAGIGRVAAH